jgi:hypothetical protein
MEEFLGRVEGANKRMRRLLGYGRASHVIPAFARRCELIWSLLALWVARDSLTFYSAAWPNT